MQYRHEIKHEINYADMLILRSRLSCVMKPDSHAVNGKYDITSLYFDDIRDTALREKLDGVSKREKFRLRYYNDDLSLIFLEKKSKLNGLCLKEQCVLTKEEAEAIVSGNREEVSRIDKQLCRDLYRSMTSKGLMPRTIVKYTREPYVYDAGNVRVTIDSNIRTGLRCTDFLNTDSVTVPVRDGPIILEVKWDEFLPTIIRNTVQLSGRRAAAFSKYAACRMYD